MSPTGSGGDRVAGAPDNAEGADGSAAPAGPVTRTRYATSDVEEATELLRSIYVEHAPAFSGDQTDFSLTLDSDAMSSPLGGVQLDRLRHTMTVTAPVEPMVAQLTNIVVLSGRVRYVLGRREAHSVLLAPSWTRFRIDWDDIDVLVSSIDPDAVRRVGAEMSGLEPADVAFTDMTPSNPARGRMFAALLVHLKRDLLAHDEALASPLMRAETFRHLATTILITFPNTALDALSDPDARGPGRTEPATVRRAVAFVEECAHEPIGLAEIAVAARVSPRGLQHAFARHRDTTPLGYLRHVRLERAHRDLAAADPTVGDTVAAIAARWGFAHPGRFSSDYRARFGCSPSETLRR